MSNYDIKYEIIDYKRFYQRIEELCHNVDNRVTFTRETPIGLTRCGFAIEHLKTGNGPVHITYAAGIRGDEVSGVNYIFEMMNSIAKGNGCFEDFDPGLYTIDFLPCLNPEGYFTTTYAIKDRTKDMSEYDFEQFARMYESACVLDDKNVFAIDKCIKVVFEKCQNRGGDTVDKLTSMFWRLNKGKDIHYVDLINYLAINTDVEDIESIVDGELRKWKIDKDFVIGSVKYHDKLFAGTNLDCIPMFDQKHIALKMQISKLYQDGNFDFGTLSTFGANSNGVNLTNNNEVFFNRVNGVTRPMFGYGKYNNVCISIPGPYGVPGIGNEFEMEPEHKSLKRFISDGGDMFVYCSGTGDSIYSYRKDYSNLDEYSRQLRESFDMKMVNAYKSGVWSSRKVAPHSGVYPLDIIGIKKDIRDMYDNSFMIQFGLGANPLGFHFNKEKYISDMISYMEGNKDLMSIALEYYRVNHLTSEKKSYGM